MASQESHNLAMVLRSLKFPGWNVRGLTGLSAGMYGTPLMSGTILLAMITAEEHAIRPNPFAETIFNRLVGPLWIMHVDNVNIEVFRKYVRFTKNPTNPEWAILETKLHDANIYFRNFVFGDKNPALRDFAWGRLRDYDFCHQADPSGTLIAVRDMTADQLLRQFAEKYSFEEFLIVLGPLKKSINS
ncbi:uncharacterized protein N0V89_008866 [Didymosphaeria variabile]|uniref:Uncharacterized protein n=1 Tax=Didymosphaeria variabile TaxID=1932322 RepID=A0A9W8XH31_9PLEO|nr:uncharacterized protein N0V89_008866 [Didymosphaeria variabile]KAJ4350245.1 hypothetical protein N0V89_008866 [Didymosphaeria variabile]